MIDYNEEVQKILISFMLSDPQAYAQCQNIVDHLYFDDKLKPAVRFIQEHTNKYHVLPLPEQVMATTGRSFDVFPPEYAAQQSEWFLETMEGFCQYKAIERAVLDGVEMIQNGKYGELERRIKDAVSIGLMRDLGLSYYEDPKARLERMRDHSTYISTGIELLDEKLYGGFIPGALNVFAGGSGSGKSLMLQNLALNWSNAGLNVIYFSLELAEDLVALRLDAMKTGMSTTDVMKNISDASLKIKMGSRNCGDLIVKKLPEAGTTTNDLRAFIKEWEIKTGKHVHAICVDYLDLMYPNGAGGSFDISNLFVKDKYVSEELRALAGERNFIMATASQLNRQSVETQEFDHSHIAGGISKINTADNVFAILATPSMREGGKYQLQFMKVRSSSATGHRIDLAYNPSTMRITDPSPESMNRQSNSRNSASQIKTEINQAAQSDGSVSQKQDMRDMISRVRSMKLS